MNSTVPVIETLRCSHEAIINEMIAVIAAEASVDAAMAPDVLRVVVCRFVEHILEHIDDFRPEVVRTFGYEAFSSWQKQGGRFAQMRSLLRTLRRMFVDRVWDSGASMADGRAVVERIDDIFDTVGDSAAHIYDKNPDEAEASTELLEEDYRQLYLRTPAMMHTTDARGRIVAVNERWLETLGYSIDEVLGRNSAEFLTQESHRHSMEVHMPKLEVEGKLRDALHQFVKKNGEIIDVHLSAVAITDELGKPKRFLVTFDDVTADLQMAQALRESEERWRALMDMAPLPLVMHKRGIAFWGNDAAVSVLGMKSHDELLGINILDFLHPDEHARVIERLRRGDIVEEVFPPIELHALRKDGTPFRMEVLARSILYRGEHAILAALIDITERIQAEEMRRTSEAQAQMIAAQEEALEALSTPLIPLGDGIVVLPLVGRVSEDRASRILSTLAEGVVAQSASAAIVDVTGVPEANVGVAATLLRMAQTVRLLGAEVVITGVQPAMARVLVELGEDFSAIATRGTLRDGIDYALRRCRGGRGDIRWARDRSRPAKP